MADDLVTVASFTHPVEAWVEKLRLDHAGVKSFVADDNIVSMYWLCSNAVGGVKLQVAHGDLQAAAEILSGEPAISRDGKAELCTEVPATLCPKCGSAEIYWQKCWRRAVFLCWLLLGFPLPILRRSWSCFDCHAWGQLRIQFTLRTLLILTFIVAVICSLVRTVSTWVPDFGGAESVPYP
jgi:hypothetical protein